MSGAPLRYRRGFILTPRLTKTAIIAEYRRLLEDAELLQAKCKNEKGNAEERLKVIEALRTDLAGAQVRIGELEQANSALVNRPPVGYEKLLDERRSDTWHLRIGDKTTGISPYVHFGFYPSGRLAEVFIDLDKTEKQQLGGGLADAAAMAFSVAVRQGANLEMMAWKWIGIHGGPCGPVWVMRDTPPEMNYAQAQAYAPPLKHDLEVWSCTSILDAIAKRILVRYLGKPRFCPPGALEEDAPEPTP